MSNSKIAIVALALLAIFALAAARRHHYIRSHIPAKWNRIQPADPDENLTVYLSLKQNNLDQLEKLFWEVSTPGSARYRQFMTKEQITALVSVTPAQKDELFKTLNLYNPREVEFLGDAVKFSMFVKDASKFFETDFHVFTHQKSGLRLIRQMGPYSVPTEIDHLVEMVSGISNFPVNSPTRHFATQDSQGIVAQSLQALYNVPSQTTGSAKYVSQGVIEFQGQSFSPSQLATYSQKVGVNINPLPASHIVGPNSPFAPQTEATLDIQMIAALNPAASNYFWLAPSADWVYLWAVSFNNAAAVPNVTSISYGWNEADQCVFSNECQVLGVNSQGYVARTNTEFQKMGLRGVSVFVSSGDSGANGRTDEMCTAKKLFPAFPAASPFVTAVGATQLNNPVFNLPNPPPICNSGYPCASGGEEVAVSYAVAGFASGGGFSNYSPRPSYQAKAVSDYLNSGVALPPAGFFNTSNRGFPDIAAIGHNTLIWMNQVAPVGGTSASAPISAAVFSMLNEEVVKSTGKPLGFLNPLIYKMVAENPSTFNDITVGDNKCTESGCGFGNCKGFLCAKGWDPVTGVGSPNYSAILKYLKANM